MDPHTNHHFVSPTDADLMRSPCPALNALANHNYIPHDGENIPYTTLISALCLVYNISKPLSIILCTVGYIISGKMSLSFSPSSTTTSTTAWLPRPHVQWTLSLRSLSALGPLNIAHDAALVHPDGIPTHAPDCRLSAQLTSYATSHHGISLQDFADLHACKLKRLARPLNNFHEQIALGEYGLSWALMRTKQLPAAQEGSDVIPVDRIRQWICEERLPDDWWSVGRPNKTVGLFEARSHANTVQKLMKMRRR